MRFAERYQAALELMCGKAPSLELCERWLFTDDGDLQDWVCSNLRPSIVWAQGCGVLDAAYDIASQPDEGSKWDDFEEAKNTYHTEKGDH